MLHYNDGKEATCVNCGDNEHPLTREMMYRDPDPRSVSPICGHTCWVIPINENGYQRYFYV